MPFSCVLIERSKLGCFYLFLELHNDLLSDIFKKKNYFTRVWPSRI